MNPFDLIWIFIVSSLQPAIQQRLLRPGQAQALQKRNGSRAIDRVIERRLTPRSTWSCTRPAAWSWRPSRSHPLSSPIRRGSRCTSLTTP